MATFNGRQMGRLAQIPADYPDAADVGGRVRIFNEAIDLATIASNVAGDIVNVAKLPKGARVLYGILNSTVSLGTATISVGNATDAAKYRAAAVFTAVNTPTFFGVAANVGAANTAEETVYLTIGVAALPATGTLRVMLFYSID